MQRAGLTPAQLMDQSRPERLSFLYKTIPFGHVTIQQPKDHNEKNNHIRVFNMALLPYQPERKQ